MKTANLLYLWIHFWLLLPVVLSCQTAFPHTGNLCYTESYVQKIKVLQSLQTSTLTLQDKLKFTEKSFVKKHRTFFKKGGYPVHEISYINSLNWFPKWYQTADLIRIDETGIRSFYQRENEYLPGGWAGHIYSNTENGFYGTADGSGRERFYHQPHTAESQTAYNLQKTSLSLFGYFSEFRFFYPTTAMLKMLEGQGFQTSQQNNSIRISNPEIQITWRIAEKTITRQFYKNGIPVKSVITKYKYVETLGQDLKYHELEIIPGQLDNGDCIETEASTYYSEYSTDCTGNDTQLRSDQKEEVEKMTILPNPATELITLVLPDSPPVSVIHIVSAAGRIMYSRYGEKGNQIDISSFPEGIYFVTATAGTRTFTSKFVKP